MESPYNALRFVLARHICSFNYLSKLLVYLVVPKGTVFVVANLSNLVHRIKLCNMLQHHFEALSRIYSLPVEFIQVAGYT